jgi:HK97 family phage portal protein
MGFFSRIFASSSRTSGPFFARDPALATLFGFVPSAAGINVDEFTALNYSAVWAATRIISDPLAFLPLVLYEREGKGAKRPAVDHPVYQFWACQPNPETSSYNFRESRMAQVLSWGNTYAEIERDNAGRPLAIWQQSPREIRPDRNKSGKYVYQVHGTDGIDRAIPAENMWHVPGLGFDGLVGYSVIRLARESIGLGLAQERFGATFFGNGCRPGGTLKHPGQPTQAAREETRRSIEAMHQGPDRAHRLAVMWGGIEWDPKSGIIPPEEAQFLGSREFQRGEIALWFNVPPMKLGLSKTATYASAQQFAVDFVTYSLMPWAVKIENECDRKLLTEDERRQYYHKYDFSLLLRGDMAGRTTAMVQQLQNGVLTPDEWREIEDRNPLPDDRGGECYRPSNLVQIGEEPDAAGEAQAPAPKPPPAGPEQLVEPKRKRSGAEMVRAQRNALGEVLGRLARKEAAALRRAAKDAGKFLAAAEAFWAEGFEEEFRVALVPQLRVWTAWCGGGQAESQAAAAAAGWKEQSCAGLLELAGQCRARDLEERAGQLLERWERERPLLAARQIICSHGSTRKKHGKRPCITLAS